MFTRITAATALTASIVFTAQAQDFVTRSDAVLCVSPFSLKEAHVAANTRDEKWLKSLGCIIARAGISAVLIETNSLGRKARLRLPSGEGVTVWGYGGEFVAVVPPAAPSRPAVNRESEDAMFAELKQIIVRSGNDCERVSAAISDDVGRAVTCQNGTASVGYSITARDGATTVQKIEPRR